jgi:hypothetical protein
VSEPNQSTPDREQVIAELCEALEDAMEVLDIADSYGLYEPGSLGDLDIKDSRDKGRQALSKARGAAG